ncbi:hypothetical protein J7T55_001364 [Diaporthe amygdali]|uniref:uncharacterized protein n=1 Tax=Phomopsis amygdali TaxID=1214568 RepID=UPI0022FEBD5B|nr:uncharacterized protein J7T55_001364 [Diaporthe amygdali]KAJ0103791.1 hypothetical protein J7T55_001364 [Diaporthe amygdali]
MAHPFLKQAPAISKRELAALDTYSLREIDLEDSERLSDDVAQNGTAETARSNLQRTYSRRGRKARGAPSTSGGPKSSTTGTWKRIPKRTITQPGEIVLPTPLIRRARGQQLSSPIQQPPLADAGGGVAGKKRFAALQGQRTPSVIAALESEMQPLRSRVSPTKFSLYDSILRAVHALLTATAASSSNSLGHRSLVAMCLRKVPEYIGELEYWEQRDAEEQGTKSTLQNSDISNEIYGQVEAMLPASHGAGHLRMVVRAHCVKVVRDSIAEGLLDDGFSILLIKLCCKTKSFREGEELLRELTDRSYPKPKGVDSTFEESRKLATLKILRDFARESDRPQFMQRQLCNLLSKQQLPLLWLSTKEFGLICQESRESRQHYEAMTALIGSIAQCCGRGSTQPSHYYLTKLCDQLELELSPECPPKTLRMDCAFILAERTNDLRDLAFAESLDAAGCTQEVLPTPRRKSASSSYRWDEDICEWITVTPAPMQRQRQRRSLSSSLSPLPGQNLGPGGGQDADSAKRLQPKQRQKLARGVSAHADSAVKTSRRLRSGTSLGKRDLEAHQSADPLLDDGDDEGVEALGAQRNSSNENGLSPRQDGAKRRRTTTLKPSRAILKTITNIARDDACSEDELGL